MKSSVFEQRSQSLVSLDWVAENRCSSRQVDYTLAKGTTQVLSTNVKKIAFDVVNEKVKSTTAAGGHEAMELA